MAFVFGVGTLQVSGTAGSFSLAKLQNVKLDISYDNAQLRGGVDVFPVDSQFFNGKAEGSFEHADVQLSQIAYLMAGSGAFAGAGGSGTFTLTATHKPKAFQMVFSGVTNGITGTWKLQKVYIPQLSMDYSRTDYMIPSMNFVCDSTGGVVLTWQQ